MEQIILNRSYLLRKATFWGDFSYAHAIFLRAVYLFHHSNCSHTSLEVVYLFLSQKAWQAFILWSVMYLFWQENLQSSIVWVILSAEICLFPKEVGSSYAFFKVTIIIFIEYSQPSIFSTVLYIFMTLKFAAI